MQDILARMKFADQIERLSDPDAPLLYQIICDFCKPQADMSPDKIRAVDMGYIFENLIQRFSESYDEDAGAHFTSRDIVYLMTDLLIQADSHVFDGDRITKTVYDQTMGTSQMLGLHRGAPAPARRRGPRDLLRPGVQSLHFRHREGERAHSWRGRR